MFEPGHVYGARDSRQAGRCRTTLLIERSGCRHELTIALVKTKLAANRPTVPRSRP